MECFKQQGAGEVVAPDVVLDVERALSRPRQQHARGKGIVSVEQGMNAGFAFMEGNQRRNALAEFGLTGLGLRDGQGVLPTFKRWQVGAACQQHGQQAEGEQCFTGGLVQCLLCSQHGLSCRYVPVIPKAP